jgi:hypothetical protein
MICWHPGWRYGEKESFLLAHAELVAAMVADQHGSWACMALEETANEMLFIRPRVGKDDIEI